LPRGRRKITEGEVRIASRVLPGSTFRSIERSGRSEGGSTSSNSSASRRDEMCLNSNFGRLRTHMCQQGPHVCVKKGPHTCVKKGPHTCANKRGGGVNKSGAAK